MSTNEQTHGLAAELAEAIHEFRDALRRAGDATRALDALAPRIDEIAVSVEEMEAVLRRCREQMHEHAAPAPSTTADASATTPASLTPAPPFPVLASKPPRPTLVVPGPRVPQWGGPRPAAAAASNGSQHAPTPAAIPVVTSPPAEVTIAPRTPTTSFRLAFECVPGPLDLRAVDDAISAHPAVSDVALLDYDGHRATLKVWIAEPARPADVQRALIASAPEVFPDNQVNITALDDAA